MLNAGKLRHRIRIESLVTLEDSAGEVQDSFGSLIQDWEEFITLWAAIEPISAREFTAAQAEQSKIIARITVRYVPGINAAMRIYHEAKDVYYNIEGILSDRESGIEYLTLPCSEGVRFVSEQGQS